ncbi:hypothetical protein E2C01_053480 [Portunus trituberculatus]|uniref:Uncharacterized protein n=1 Tax=Portunus trituberculatus TaxID=210409 RepID=A0A5B7GKG5_PORTR|nr:hypothetical protein [Portunus trituberculatus]
MINEKYKSNLVLPSKGRHPAKPGRHPSEPPPHALPGGGRRPGPARRRTPLPEAPRWTGTAISQTRLWWWWWCFTPLSQALEAARPRPRCPAHAPLSRRPRWAAQSPGGCGWGWWLVGRGCPPRRWNSLHFYFFLFF